MTEVDFEEILIAPLEDIVKKIADAIAYAQTELDRSALELQKNLKQRYPELAELGYLVTWYHMPEIDVELKMVMHYEREEGKFRPFWAPFNAKYKTHFSFEAEGTSVIKIKIRPIPPPVSLTIPK
mgnify:CR=1 FL=1